MSKPSTPRHSKPSKPVTLDLDAKDVTRAEEGSDGKDEVSTAAPKSPSSSDDRSARPSQGGKETDKKPEDQKEGDNASKTAASGLGVGAASDVKPDEKSTKPGATAASGLAASQTGSEAGKSTSRPSGPSVSGGDRDEFGKDKDKDKEKARTPFDSKPTIGSPMGAASSAAAASTAAASSGPSTSSASPSSSASGTKPGATTSSSASAKPAPSKSPDSRGASRGGSRGGAVVGGVVGAALGIAALFGLQAAHLLPAPGGSSGTDTAALEGEISSLKSTLDELRASVAQAPAGSADLSGRLDALESAVASGSTSGDTAPALGEFNTRLQALSEKVDGLTSGDGASGEVRQQIAGLSGRVDDMSGSLSDVQTRLGELGSRLDTLDKGQSELSTSLTGRIEKAEQAIEEPGREMEMAKAIAVSGLKSAVDRGGPFASELEAFASVAPDNPAVSGLREFAATGVPTQGELVERFPDAANVMIAAMDPVPENAGILDRLAASAKSMVKVRKVGDVEGDSTEAIAARLENQLRNGNLEAAVAEWNALPDQARAAAPEFGKGLIARAEVEKLITEVQLPAVAESQPQLEPAAPEEGSPAEPASSTSADAPAATPSQSE
jgi:hypothetical protein